MRATFARWSDGQRDVDPADVHPEAQVVSQLAHQVFHGHEGIRRWTSDVMDAFAEWRMEIVDIHESGTGRLLVVGRVQLKGRGSGVDLDAPCAWVFDFRDGQMFRMEIFINRVEAAFEAAGLAA